VGKRECTVAHAVTPDASFWAGKRVFLTGHTGFKGAWLALWLKRLGADVTGYGLAPDTTPNLCDLAEVEQHVRSIRGDIRDGAAVAAAMGTAAPEIVLHLAAQPLVRRSYLEPVLTFETNLLGTIHVLEAVRRTPSVAAIVVITTDKCYENRDWVWAYRESDALGGHDPYSASKACAEIAVAAWRRSFLMRPHAADHVVPIASARAGNVIGGGDWADDRLIPDCIRAFTTGTPALIRNPHATRPWQHVLEPLCGYLMLTERLWHEGSDHAVAWNFGPAVEDVQPVSHIVGQLVTEWDGGARWLAEGHDHPREDSLLAVDASMARTKLGWQPRLRLVEAISWTVHWYKCQLRGKSASRLIEEDISRYEQITRNVA
jgi:CDP-glucose 4,6-dehydratase